MGAKSPSMLNKLQKKEDLSDPHNSSMHMNTHIHVETLALHVTKSQVIIHVEQI